MIVQHKLLLKIKSRVSRASSEDQSADMADLATPEYKDQRLQGVQGLGDPAQLPLDGCGTAHLGDARAGPHKFPISLVGEGKGGPFKSPANNNYRFIFDLSVV
jgi:hypothetical protein